VVALATLVLASTGAGACGVGGGRDNGSTAGVQVSPPAGPDDLVVRLSELPGMLPPGGAAAVLPTFSLYGDGRLISAPVAGAAGWPVFDEYRVPTDDVRGLLQAAADTGILADTRPPTSSFAGPDAPVAVVTAVSGGMRRTGSLPRSDRAVTHLRAELTRHAAGSHNPYRPAAVAVIANPTTASEPARSWPLGSLDGQPLTGLGAGSRCTVLRGADIDAAREAAAGANPATVWRSGDRLWTVVFRPLLPDEPGCAAL